MITRLSRAMRSLRHLLNLTAEFGERGVHLQVLKQGIDTSTPLPKAFLCLPKVGQVDGEVVGGGEGAGVVLAQNPATAGQGVLV
jgi:hypothetical protein